MPQPRTIAASKEQLLEELARTPSPKRRERRIRNALLLLSAIAAPMWVWWDAGGVRIQSRPLWYVLGTGVGWLVVAAWAIWGSLAPGPSMLGRGRRMMHWIILLTPASLFVWMLAWDFIDPDRLVPWPERFGWKCFRLTLFMGAWPVIALLWMRRGSEPLHPGVRGAAIGAAVGCATGVLLDLWCPIADPMHVIKGHILPLLILSGAGLLLGRWLLAAGRGILDRRANRQKGDADGQ